MSDRFDLQRFVSAQDERGTFEQALGELRAGRKTSHWMWFVFPQLRGLGQSPTARHYGIDGIDEARAYLAHDPLGPRLLESFGLVADSDAPSAAALLGPVDAMKLRSSATLFARAATDPAPFVAVLERFFDGKADGRTDALLAAG